MDNQGTVWYRGRFMLHDSRQIQASVSSESKTKETQCDQYSDCRKRRSDWMHGCVPYPIWNRKEEICVLCACTEQTLWRFYFGHKILPTCGTRLQSGKSWTFLDQERQGQLEICRTSMTWQTYTWANQQQSGHFECWNQKRLLNCGRLWSRGCHQQQRSRGPRRTGQTGRSTN